MSNYQILHDQRQNHRMLALILLESDLEDYSEVFNPWHI